MVEMRWPGSGAASSNPALALTLTTRAVAWFLGSWFTAPEPGYDAKIAPHHAEPSLFLPTGDNMYSCERCKKYVPFALCRCCSAALLLSLGVMWSPRRPT